MKYHRTIVFIGENVGGNSIQKPAIVGDNHGVAGEGEKGLFQSSQGFNIQVIGRLIQLQYIGAAF